MFSIEQNVFQLAQHLLMVLVRFLFSDADECESNPCKNGATCIDDHYKYNCSCALGFEGIHCESSKLAVG